MPGIVFLISRPVAAYAQAASDGKWGDSWVEPPLDFHYSVPDDASLDHMRRASGLLFSSQTAVEVVTRAPWPSRPGLACWCVGRATADAARAAGFAVQAYADGGGARLVDALDAGQISLPASGLVWLRVTRPAFALDQALAARGIALASVVGYDSAPKPKPSPALSAWLSRHPRAGVALFSQDGARAYAAWRERLAGAWRPTEVLAIGPRVVEPFVDPLTPPTPPTRWPTQAARDDMAALLRAGPRRSGD